MSLLISSAKPRQKESYPRLIKQLWSVNAYVRENAVRDLGTPGKKAIPELIKALRSTNQFTREAGTRVLAQIGKLAVPEVVKLLKDRMSYVRQTAAYTLGIMYEKTIDAERALKIALNDKDIDVRKEAEISLREYGFFQNP